MSSGRDNVQRTSSFVKLRGVSRESRQLSLDSHRLSVSIMADIPAKIDVSPAGAHSQTKGLKPRRGSHTRLNPDGTHPLQTQWKFWCAFICDVTRGID